MTRRHFDALFMVDLRRTFRTMRTVFLLVGAGVGVMVLLGRGTAENLLLLLMGAGLGLAVTGVPTTVTRDKIDQNLELLCTLPTTASTVVLAKFASGAIFALPWSLGVAAVVAVFGLPEDVALGAFHATVGFLAASWICLALISWCFTALAARYKPEDMGVSILGLLIGGLVVGFFLDTFGPSDPIAVLRWLDWFLIQPWAPLALITTALTISAGTAAVAFTVTRNALVAYRPAPAESN